MVKLCCSIENISLLEYALIKNDIPFEVEPNPPDCGMEEPFLLVDGVPLDVIRAIKWIEGQSRYE